KRFLRRKKVLRSVEVRAEGDSVVPHFAEIAQAEHLKAAGVGKDRVRPRHELMKAAHAADEFVARAKIQMVSIGEENLDAEVFEVLLRLAFYGGGRADRHERRRFDHAVGRRKTPQPRTRRIGRENLEMKTHPMEFIRRRPP